MREPDVDVVQTMTLTFNAKTGETHELYREVESGELWVAVSVEGSDEIEWAKVSREQWDDIVEDSTEHWGDNLA